MTENRVTDNMISLKIKLRSAKRQSATKALATLEHNFPESEADIRFNMEKLTTIRDNLINFDNEIEVYMLKEAWDDETYFEQNSVCEEYNDKLSAMIVKLKIKLEHVHIDNTNMRARAAAVDAQDNAATVGANLTKLKLPKVELPVFDGKPESYNRFIDSLECILMKFNLTPYEKYSYLRQQVSGPARVIVKSLPDYDLTYNSAKNLLESAFSDVTLQQFSVISRLSTLKMRGTDEFYNWISEARQIDAQISKLGITSDIVLQYFLWCSLPDKFKQAFITVTSKVRPNKQEIIDRSFEVYNCMKESNTTLPKTSVTLATTVAPDFPNTSDALNSVKPTYTAKAQK